MGWHKRHGRRALLGALVCTTGIALGVPASALASGPEAITVRAYSTAKTTAVLEGFVNPSGQSTRYAAAYGLATSQWCASRGANGSPEHETTPQFGPTQSNFFLARVELAGLSTGSEYCAAVLAENASGLEYGPQLVFTAGAPSALTLGASSTAATTATVEGEVNPAGQATDYHVDYGLASSEWCSSHGSKGSAGQESPPLALGVTDAAFHPVSAELSGLTAGREYCAELVASNESGKGVGGQVSFTAGVPTVFTSGASGISTNAATVEGGVNPAGQATHYRVAYGLATSSWCESSGTTGAPEHATVPAGPLTGSALLPVAVELTGLSPGSEYCAELTAENASGAGLGGQILFTTKAVHSLTVGVGGSGHGSVSGAGISCPPICSASYPTGTHVTLTAAPAAGSTFSGWSGACSGTTTCTITLSANRQVVANFTANPAPPPPPPPPTSNFTLRGSPRVNPRSGAVTFSASVSDPGVLSWILSFKNGTFGVLAMHRSRCGKGQVKIRGRCRSAAVIFGRGTMTVIAAGTVSFTVMPSASAKRALRAGLRRGQGLPVTAVVSFQASGGSPVSHTYSLTDKLKASGRGRHAR